MKGRFMKSLGRPLWQSADALIEKERKVLWPIP